MTTSNSSKPRGRSHSGARRVTSLFLLAFLCRILSLVSKRNRQLQSLDVWSASPKADQPTRLVATNIARNISATNLTKATNSNSSHTFTQTDSHLKRSSSHSRNESTTAAHSDRAPKITKAATGNARDKRIHTDSSLKRSSSRKKSVKTHSYSFNFKDFERTTTCKGRQGLQNRTLLPINISAEGGFPETQFTHHIKKSIIENLNTEPFTKPCDAGFISITQDQKTVIVEYLPTSPRTIHLLDKYATFFSKRVFSEECQRSLPQSSSIAAAAAAAATIIGFQSGDWSSPEYHEFRCFAIGSSPEGLFHVFNFHSVRDATYNRSSSILDNLLVSRYRKPSWEERDPIPVWRGTLWGWEFFTQRAVAEGKGRTPQEVVDHFFEVITTPEGSHHQRIPLVQFSRKYPDLLNAAGGIFEKNFQGTDRNAERFREFIHGIPNSNFTVEDFFPPFRFMNKRKYYSKYQVAVVMGGIGAAFRTADHMAMETAVILQDFPYQEWFYPYLTPYVDYIPLARNLSNLNETLHWIRDNPKKVKDVATNGRLFYERYLSYEKMEEYFYELVYRLAEARIYKGIHLNIPPSVMNLTSIV